MAGMVPLTRSLPETSRDTHGLVEDGGVTRSPESMAEESVRLVSDSGSISHRLSSSLTTSAIEGRVEVSSRQHLRPRFMNFSTQSDGNDAIFSSMMVNMEPARCATLT